MKEFPFDKHSYQIPENYFEEMERELYLKTKISTDNTTHFSVPKDYFETLENQIVSQTIGKQTNVISISYKKWISIASIAACLLIGLLTWNYVTNLEKPSQRNEYTRISEQNHQSAAETLYETFIEENDSEQVAETETTLAETEEEDILYTYYTLLSDDEMPTNTATKTVQSTEQNASNSSKETEEILYEVFVAEPTIDGSEDEFPAYF